MENDFWANIRKGNIKFEEYEKYLYNNYYLDSFQSNYNGYEYNRNLHTYFFSAKSFLSYDNAFFQNMLDGDIEKKEYYRYEKSLIRFISNFYQDDCYTYFFGEKLKDMEVYDDFEIPLKNEGYFNQDLNGKIVKLDDVFTDFLTLVLREIYNCDLIFTKSKIIIQLSGLHGVVISERQFEEKEILNYLQFIEEFVEYQ